MEVPANHVWKGSWRLLALALVSFAVSSVALASEVKESAGSFESGGKTIAVDRYGQSSLPNNDAKLKLPAVIIVHGAGGLNEHAEAYKKYAQDLAAAGYMAFVVHYFDRTETKSTDDKTIRMNFLTWMKTLQDAATYAGKQPNVDEKKIGLLGFSLGSYLSLATAGRDPRFGAVVEYFGGYPGPLAAMVQKMPPTLILHGEDDKSVSVQEAHKLEELLKSKHATYEIKLYPGQGHGFTGEDSKDAVKRALAFFDKHLKNAQPAPAQSK